MQIAFEAKRRYVEFGVIQLKAIRENGDDCIANFEISDFKKISKLGVVVQALRGF